MFSPRGIVTFTTRKGIPWLRQSRRQKDDQRAAFGLSWWFTCSAERLILRRARSRCSTSSRTTESIPPLRAATIRARGRTIEVSWAPARSINPSALRTGDLLLRFLELAITDQLFQARFHELVDRFVLQLAPRVLQRLAQVLQHRIVIAVRPARRLAHDAVDEAQRLQARCRDPERFRGFCSIVRALPQDGRATFGRNHRVGGVLEHQGDVAYRDRERAAGAALADDGADHRHLQLRHRIQVAPDGLGLASLLGPDARVRAGCINECKQRDTEFLRELHETQRLPEAFGPGHPEVAVELLLGVASLLVAEDHAGLSAKTRDAADDRGIVTERAVAVQLLETREDAVHVIERVRALRMARDLRDLPRVEL